jgi:hypothetical protein
VAGKALTITLIVEDKALQFPTVTVTEYTPAINVDALINTGFCVLSVKAFGPVHVNVEPTAASAKRLRVLPTQIGALLVKIGIIC